MLSPQGCRSPSASLVKNRGHLAFSWAQHRSRSKANSAFKASKSHRGVSHSSVREEKWTASDSGVLLAADPLEVRAVPRSLFRNGAWS